MVTKEVRAGSCRHLETPMAGLRLIVGATVAVLVALSFFFLSSLLLYSSQISLCRRGRNFREPREGLLCFFFFVLAISKFILGYSLGLDTFFPVKTDKRIMDFIGRKIHRRFKAYYEYSIWYSYSFHSIYHMKPTSLVMYHK